MIVKLLGRSILILALSPFFIFILAYLSFRKKILKKIENKTNNQFNSNNNINI